MRKILLMLLPALLLPVLAVSSPEALADGPGVGAPWIVSLGDSYISGEAGRWAGNSNTNAASVDAGGSSAYLDSGDCHRSTAAEIHIGTAADGSPVNSLNLACSGARTVSSFSSDGTFRPGIDFYNSGGRRGQALALQQFASSNNVRMVVLSIGGNNFNFASIVQRCISNFLTSSSLFPNYCYDDTAVSSNFSKSNISAQTAAIRTAIDNVKRAMAAAGYTTAQYSIMMQTYPSPIPNGSGFRYSQSGFSRQSTGGCGFWNRDADWANATALTKINTAVVGAATAANSSGNVRVLDVARALNGRRLCETSVQLMETTGLGSWTAARAVDLTEWVAQIRTVSTIGSPYQVQESLHPNWWGQKAVRSCVRQAWNNGVPRGGACVRSGSGLSVRAEPVMTLN